MRPLLTAPIKTKIIRVEEKGSPPEKSLLDSLSNFAHKHYFIESTSKFIDSTLRPKQAGEIQLYYGGNDSLIGFTRVYQQNITYENKYYTVFSTHVFSNPAYTLGPIPTKFGLTQSMRQRLHSPDKELAYVSGVMSPEKYAFLANLSNTVYPSITKTTMPKYVYHLIDEMQPVNLWNRSSNDTLIIKNLPIAKSFPKQDVDISNPHCQYYNQRNPNYQSGEALLVYIPLTLENIAQGLRKLIKQDPMLL